MDIIFAYQMGPYVLYRNCSRNEWGLTLGSPSTWDPEAVKRWHRTREEALEEYDHERS